MSFYVLRMSGENSAEIYFKKTNRVSNYKQVFNAKSQKRIYSCIWLNMTYCFLMLAFNIIIRQLQFDLDTFIKSKSLFEETNLK